MPRAYPAPIYSEEDFLNHRCLWEEVGLPIRDDNYATRLARQHAPAAIRALVDVANNAAGNPGARVKAANSILDRGFGRPEGSDPSDRNAAIAAVQDELPWVSARRLLYQMGAKTAEDIVAHAPRALSDPTPEPSPSEPPAEALGEPVEPFEPTPKGVGTPGPSEGLKAPISEPASEPADVRRDYGPRGHAKHK